MATEQTGNADKIMETPALWPLRLLPLQFLLPLGPQQLAGAPLQTLTVRSCWGLGHLQSLSSCCCDQRSNRNKKAFPYCTLSNPL